MKSKKFRHFPINNKTILNYPLYNGKKKYTIRGQPHDILSTLYIYKLLKFQVHPPNICIFLPCTRNYLILLFKMLGFQKILIKYKYIFLLWSSLALCSLSLYLVKSKIFFSISHSKLYIKTYNMIIYFWRDYVNYW